MIVDPEDIQNMNMILLSPTNFQFLILMVCARISHRVLYMTILNVVKFFDGLTIFFPV